MGVATTTDPVRTSFEALKNLYGMSVQVDETAKKQKRGRSTDVGKIEINPKLMLYVKQ